jgi:hypothetical protein
MKIKSFIIISHYSFLPFTANRSSATALFSLCTITIRKFFDLRIMKHKIVMKCFLLLFFVLSRPKYIDHFKCKSSINVKIHDNFKLFLSKIWHLQFLINIEQVAIVIAGHDGVASFQVNLFPLECQNIECFTFVIDETTFAFYGDEKWLHSYSYFHFFFSKL